METLRAPASWWALGVLATATVWLVLAVATPEEITLAGGLTSTAVVVGGLVAVSRVRVGVADGEVVAGRAHIPLRYCGSVRPLDTAATRRARGPDADANAFLVMRPWVGTAVLVEIADPADPTPYWLVSTRQPDRFASAARTAREMGHDRPGGATDEG